MIRELIEQIELEQLAEEKLATAIPFLGPAAAGIAGYRAAGPEDRGRGVLYGLGGGAALGIPSAVAGHYGGGALGGALGGGKGRLIGQLLGGTLGAMGGGYAGGRLAGGAAKGHTAKERAELAKEIVRQQQMKKTSADIEEMAEIELLAQQALAEMEKQGMSFLKMRRAVSQVAKEAPKATSGTPNPRLFGKLRVGGGAGRAKTTEVREAYRAAQRRAGVRR